MTPLQLSPRQIEVCCLVAAGETDKAIGKELGCSSRTVQAHMEEAARRLRDADPTLPTGRARRVILAYYVACYGVAAFQRRLDQRKAA